jgi:DNA repair protein SbcC/Rad50
LFSETDESLKEVENTERLNSRDNRNYNMMNLKSDELLIDFEFTNFEGELYRFVVKGKRHGTEFGKVNSFMRNAYHWQQDNWIPIGSITAEEIVGLSYENFRRTIIIPQGQFQEFLELGGKERSDMLKELFHLDKYDLSGQTASLERKNNAQIQYVSGQLAQFDHVTPETCAEREKVIQTLAAEVAVLKKDLGEKEILEREQRELKKIFEDLDAKREILKGLVQKEPEIIFNEKKVAQYETCVQLFKSQLVAKKDVESRLEAKQKLFSETDESLKEVENTLISGQKEFDLIAPEFQNLEIKKAEIGDYHQIIKIRRLSAELAELENRIKIGEEKLNLENAAKEELTSKIQSQKQLIQSKKEKLPDLPELMEVKSWFAQKNLHEKNLQAFTEEKSHFETLLKAKKEMVPSKIPKSLYGDFPFLQDEKLSGYIARLDKQKYLNVTKSETIQAVINHLALQSKLEEFAQRLHDHEACPLCGSLDHPQILSVENVNESLKVNDEKLENVRKETLLIEQTIQELTKVEFEQKELLYQLETAESRIVKENEALKLHRISICRKTV